MGWKAFMIIVKSDKNLDEELLLEELGFHNREEIESDSLEVAIYPEDDEVYIGRIEGNLIICATELSMTFLSDTLSAGERILTRHYPEAEICAVNLHSVVNLWGYAVARNGQKIRARCGNADDGTILDFGAPLKEEMDLLSKAEIDENGNRLYRFDGHAGSVYQEDQVGENFVFDLTKRYFEEGIEMSEELMFESELRGFKFSKGKPKSKERKESQDYRGPRGEQTTKKKASLKNKKVAKIALIFVIFFIYQILKRVVFKD